MHCPYCGNLAEWVENKEIYGKNYGKSSVMCWLCRSCNAYVGCHNNSKKPLGTMANAETRKWRREAHKLFDPLWKSRKMSRAKAYGLLQGHFGSIIHIAECDIEMCKKIITFLIEKEKNERFKNKM